MVGEEVDPDLLLMNWPYCGCSATGGHGLCERAEPKSQSTESFSELSGSVEKYSYLLEQLAMLEKMENKHPRTVPREIGLQSHRK